MSRELATVETSSLIGQLSAIEILARHRELCGYETLDELARVLALCGQRPASCHVVLDGPDTVFISRFEPAVDFLVREIGFQLKKEVIGSSAAADASAFDSSSATLGGAGGASRASMTSTRRAPREITSLVMPRPASWQPGTPEPVVSETSADWKLFRHKIAQGLKLVEWARWANTSLLTVRLTDVVWFRPPPTAYGFEVRMTWKNVIGREQGQLFSVGDCKYTGAQPSVLELCDSKCDAPCEIDLYVYRTRTMLPRKVVGRAFLEYDNSGVVATRLDIFDPSMDTSADVADTPAPVGESGAAAAAARREAHGAAAPPPENVRGSLRIEVSSVRHRYTKLQEELIIEMATKRDAERRERLEAEERARLEKREERRRQRDEADRLRASRVGGDGNPSAPGSRAHSRCASAASSTGAVRSEPDSPVGAAPDVSAIGAAIDAEDDDSETPIGGGTPADHLNMTVAAAPSPEAVAEEVASEAALVVVAKTPEPIVAVPDPPGKEPTSAPARPAKLTVADATAASPHVDSGASAAPVVPETPKDANEAITFTAADVRKLAGVASSGAAPPVDSDSRRRRRRHAASDSD